LPAQHTKKREIKPSLFLMVLPLNRWQTTNLGIGIDLSLKLQFFQVLKVSARALFGERQFALYLGIPDGEATGRQNVGQDDRRLATRSKFGKASQFGHHNQML